MATGSATQPLFSCVELEKRTRFPAASRRRPFYQARLGTARFPTMHFTLSSSGGERDAPNNIHVERAARTAFFLNFPWIVVASTPPLRGHAAAPFPPSVITKPFQALSPPPPLVLLIPFDRRGQIKARTGFYLTRAVRDFSGAPGLLSHNGASRNTGPRGNTPPVGLKATERKLGSFQTAGDAPYMSERPSFKGERQQLPPPRLKGRNGEHLPPPRQSRPSSEASVTDN